MNNDEEYTVCGRIFMNVLNQVDKITPDILELLKVICNEMIKTGCSTQQIEGLWSKFKGKFCFTSRYSYHNSIIFYRLLLNKIIFAVF